MSQPQENQWKCRACAQTCEESEQINGLVFFHSKKTIYTELTNLEALAHDDLPKCLCSKCSDLLDQFKSFKEVCIKSDHYFRNKIFLNLKEEIDDFCFSELLKPKVKMEYCSALSDNETEDNSQFEHSVDPENVPNPSKKKAKRTQGMKTIGSSKKIRKPKKSSVGQLNKSKYKSVVKEPFPYNCLQGGCDQKFESISDFEDHQVKHADDNTISDDESGTHDKTSSMKIESDLELKLEKKTSPNTELKVKFKCEFKGCEKKKFFKQVHYDAHVKVHRGEIPFSCKICFKPLTTNSILKRHMRIHESEEERLHKCNQCHQTYFNKESFADHMKSHSGQQHVCEQCGKCFSTKSKLRGHKMSHDSAVPEQCKDCEKTFSSKTRLIKHREFWHHKTIDIAKQCLICNTNFKNQKFYQLHCKSMHTVYTTTENIFACPICGNKFRTKKNLINHKRIHSDERKYPCTQCPKTFNSSALLKKHSYFHSGERPIHCEICGKGFYQKCALDIHMNVHKRQWIAEGQQGITLHVYPKNKKKTVEDYSDCE